MKFFVITSFTLTYASSASASASTSPDNTCDNVSVAYPSNLPWVNYEGNSYIFSRQKYNSVCVDPQGQEYEYGAIEGYYGSATPCSTACVEGYSRAEQRGCSANQRPPLNNLVGFQYDCEAATCYCLYDRGTLGNQYEQCFDYMDTGYQGSGPVSTTEAQYGETCYTVEIQSQSGPPGSDYCTTPDHSCYNTPDGYPSCCSQPGGNCPPNKPPCNVGPPNPPTPGPPLGSNYCTDAPDPGCYNTPDGHPSCCNSGNCPPNKPGCDMPTPLPPQTEMFNAKGVFEASFLSNNNKSSTASASASSDDTSFALAYASSATNNNKSSTLTCLEMCVDDAVQSGKKKYSVNNKNKINKSASKCAEDCTTNRSVSKCADQCFKRLSKDVQKVVDSEVRKCERKCNNDDPDYQKCKNKCSSSKSVSKKTFKKIERKASDKSYRCLNSCVYSEGNQKYLRSQI